MTDNSIAWVEGALVAGDQRAQPHEPRQLRIATADELIAAIATSLIRGAPAIGVTAAFGVALAASLAASGDNTDEQIRRQAARIASALPTCARISAKNGAWTRSKRRRSLGTGGAHTPTTRSGGGRRTSPLRRRAQIDASVSGSKRAVRRCISLSKQQWSTAPQSRSNSAYKYCRVKSA